MIGTPVAPALDSTVSSVQHFDAQVVLGGIEFPDPVTVNIVVPVGAVLNTPATPSPEETDPVMEWMGVQGRHITISFRAANIAAPPTIDVAGLVVALHSDVAIWAMHLDDFLPRLNELYATIPPPWPIVDVDGRLARHGITHVTPTQNYTDEQLPGVNSRMVSLNLIRQTPGTGSIFRMVNQ